jgi:hypothetical protein
MFPDVTQPVYTMNNENEQLMGYVTIAQVNRYSQSQAGDNAYSSGNYRGGGIKQTSCDFPASKGRWF